MLCDCGCNSGPSTYTCPKCGVKAIDCTFKALKIILSDCAKDFVNEDEIRGELNERIPYSMYGKRTDEKLNLYGGRYKNQLIGILPIIDNDERICIVFSSAECSAGPLADALQRLSANGIVMNQYLKESKS